MTILKINSFTGMIPRSPPDRLPEGAAWYAENCNFAHGELRSLAGPAPRIPTTNPIRALFTDDGLRFYAWAVPTRAYLAPTIDDTFNRVYFNSDGQGLRVAQMNDAYLALNNPRPPAQSWAAGAARPTAEPEITLTGTTAWAQDTGATPRITAICRLAGAEVSRQVLDIATTNTAWQNYTVDLGGFSCGSDESGSGTPVAPVNGWIDGPDSCIIYLVNDVYPENESPDLLFVRGANFFGPGLWRVKSDGSIGTRASTGANFPATQPLGFAPSGVQYKGRLYSNTADLFTAIQDGSASTPAPTTAAEQALTGGEMTALFEVVGTDGAILYSGPASISGTAVTVEYQTQDKITISYATTFENTWGEESAPSDPVTVDVFPFQSILVKQAYTPLAGSRPIAGMNLYRTYPGNNSEYLKANTVPRTEQIDGKWAILDTTVAPNTSINLVTAEWDAPPSNLHNLTYAGNGYFAGASGKDLRFSEPYRPHAWPYFMTFSHAIVGVIAVEGGLLVTTTAQPYLVYGAHPEQMSQQGLNAEQAGISGRSMAKVQGNAIYASNDGLVAVSGGNADLASSQQLFTREDWRSRYKSAFRNMHLGAWDGCLIGVIDPDYPSATFLSGDFIVRLDEAPGFSRFNLDEDLLATAVSATTDEFYMLYHNGFAEFGVGADLPMTWRSRIYEYPRFVSFAAGIVKYAGTITLLIVDSDRGVSHTVVLPADKTEHHFRLPSMSPSKRWEMTVTGTGRVQYIELGSSFAELQNG